MITSSNNPQIKNLIKLQKSAKVRKEQGIFVIEGKKMFEEARDLGLVCHAYLSESYFKMLNKADFLEKEAEKIENYVKKIPYEIVSEQVMRETADTMTPQGIMGIVKMPFYSIESLLTEKNANIIFLENLRDPGNLGTIVRTAEGAGVTGIVLSKESVDLYNPKVIRSTMGSIFRMPYVYTEAFEECLLEAKKQGITLYATDLQGKNTYDREDYKKKCGIIIGNESSGITDISKKSADVLIKIPMCGRVESLNAAIAASVLMYEVFRQRRS